MITYDVDFINKDFSPGKIQHHIMVHEIGHALGLEHSFEGTSLPSAEDSHNATVMSYSKSSSSSVGGEIANGWQFSTTKASQSYQIYDIAELQYLYGANHEYNAGDDIYSYSGENYIYTLWDGAGNDTIDASGYSGSSIINLQEGLEDVTHIGETKLWMAYGADIENAITGSGNDTVHGNDLDNTLTAGSGNDVVYGYEGSDRIKGEGGGDTIYGGDGADIIAGGDNGDTLNGDAGNDITLGGEGEDLIHGNEGNDLLFGGKGDDAVWGDNDNDWLFGGSGNDSLDSGSGNDVLKGGLGQDTLSGGDGSDTFRFDNVYDSFVGMYDTITDFVQGEDLINVSSFVSSFADLTFLDDGTNTLVSDINSVFAFELSGLFTLNESDFLWT